MARMPPIRKKTTDAPRNIRPRSVWFTVVNQPRQPGSEAQIRVREAVSAQGIHGEGASRKACQSAASCARTVKAWVR